MKTRREFPDQFAVRCARKGCGAELPTMWLQMQHLEEHVRADRAMLRPSRRTGPETGDAAPLRLVVGL